MRKNPPCKKNGIDCENRHPACQDKCEEFLAWKASEKTVANEKTKESAARPEIPRSVERQIWKSMKRKG